MSEEDSWKLVEQLRDHVLQEKYIYHHDWQDGDVVIAVGCLCENQLQLLESFAINSIADGSSRSTECAWRN